MLLSKQKKPVLAQHIHAWKMSLIEVRDWGLKVLFFRWWTRGIYPPRMRMPQVLYFNSFRWIYPF